MNEDQEKPRNPCPRNIEIHKHPMKSPAIGIHQGLLVTKCNGWNKIEKIASWCAAMVRLLVDPAVASAFLPEWDDCSLRTSATLVRLQMHLMHLMHYALDALDALYIAPKLKVAA